MIFYKFMQNKFLIRKNNGEQVPFDEKKLRVALYRSGAQTKDVERAVDKVRKLLVDGMSTRKIYQLAYRVLRKQSEYAAGHYRLKKAMMELGPSGYPFEKFVGKLMEAEGYISRVNQNIKGKCVMHEVDVVATRGNEQIMIECKYHSDSTRKSDVKVVLYIHSRFLDVKASWEKENREKQYKGLVVTNTRFSDDAVEYARCSGLFLVSWDYPQSNGLKDRIDRTGLHPITSLSSLKKAEKEYLLDKGIVLCRDMNNNRQLLVEMQIDSKRINKIMHEALEILGK